jgi:hypothetical protein
VDASEPGNLAPDLPAALTRRLTAGLRRRLTRLRSMTPLEMSRRVLRLARAHAERSRAAARPAAPAPDLAAPLRQWLRPAKEVAAAPYAKAADRIAEGWLEVFALHDVDPGSPPRWNRDPKTGIEAPLEFGKLLRYADPGLAGDIKYLWEPNRHRHLVTLAQAYALTGSGKYFAALAEQLESWWLACPYPLGPNWASASEAAVRLVNWAAAWQLVFPLLKEKKYEEFKTRWLRSVYEHGAFIRGWLSLHTGDSRLIAEGAGLYIAGITWPHWREAHEWLATGKQILEREALVQVGPDGVGREQALASQQLVLEALLLCLLAAAAAGQRFSAAYEARVEAMLDFVASIMDAGGNVPMLGDSDDSPLLRLGLEKDSLKPLLATGAILFNRGDFKLKAGRLDDQARWLIGDADARFGRVDAEKTRLPLRQQFPQGGRYILGCEFGTPNEILILADAGALGLGAGAARGHADALSLTLSAGGMEFLIDPGTYAYHAQARWRGYFRGTSAHNTVRVDALDQSVQAGSFHWLCKARAGCSLWLSSGQKDSFEGWHDGYMRLPDPVKHRRLIELDKRARRVLVEDTLEMEEEHDVELFFHCSEHCQVDRAGDAFVLSQKNLSVRIEMPDFQEATTHLYSGSVAPIAGWVSRAFDERRPSPTIVWRARLAGRAILRTEMMVQAAS